MTHPTIMRRRRWLIPGAVTAALAAAGWAAWLAGRARPPLASFIPAGTEFTVELRGAGNFFARLEALDRDGALLGPAGAVTNGLRRLIGPAGRQDVLEEIGRDEALAAILPRGRWLVAFRPGVREVVVERVAATLGLMKSSGAGRGRIRTVRLPDGSRLGWARRPGVAFLASDAAVLQAALAAGGRPEHDTPAESGWPLRARWLRPSGALGRMESVEVGIRVAAGGLRAMVVLRPSPGALAAGPPVPVRPLRAGGMPPALVVFEPPDPDLVAMCSLDPGGRIAAAIESVAREAGLERRRLAALRPVIAWLGVNRDGIVPMPQLGAVIPGAADLVNDRLAARLDARLRAATRDRFRLEPAGPGWAVNFPVTRTLAPTLASAGDDAILATSTAALEIMLGPRDAGDAGAGILRPPAHAALVVDLAGLAAEADRTAAGLREYGLMSPAADRRWSADGGRWTAAARALGRLTVTGRLEHGRLILELETTPPPPADFLVVTKGD